MLSVFKNYTLSMCVSMYPRISVIFVKKKKCCPAFYKADTPRREDAGLHLTSSPHLLVLVAVRSLWPVFLVRGRAKTGKMSLLTRKVMCNKKMLSTVPMFKKETRENEMRRNWGWRSVL